MEPPAQLHEIEDRELHVEASESYLSYAMSVIVGRALPDVRDGLKPVHRRLLYAMHDLGLTAGKPYKKCARVVGEVLGKYHPHGDGAVYDALVRLAQDFSMRAPLIAGHGNFGSLDDDPAAAMRYTECRLQQLSMDVLLADLDMDTVDFRPTFDASQDEPSVLPAKVPMLLVNGSSGIAVGIATRIPPHNLVEVVNGLVALIRDPTLSSAQLQAYIPAPDFPTGGTVVVGPGAADAYACGKGHVTVRAKVTMEEGAGGSGGGARGKASKASDRSLIVISEVPYQTSKADVVARIAQLVEDKVLEGVSDVRDESDRDGMRMVVEVKKGFSPSAVLQSLFSNTRLQSRFPINIVALLEGQPLSMGVRDILGHFLEFRCGVVERRARHQQAKAAARLHLVNGFITAMAQLDTVVSLVRAAQDVSAARAALVAQVGLSEEQADGVLSLTLRRLTGMERGALEVEASALGETLTRLGTLLSDRAHVLGVVEKEALEVAAKHGTPRRSVIEVEHGASTGTGDAAKGGPAAAAAQQSPEELLASGCALNSAQVASLVGSGVTDRGCVVAVSAKGYVRRLPLPDNGAPILSRGGRGKRPGLADGLRDGDGIEHVVVCSELDSLLLVGTNGRAFHVRAGLLPEFSGKDSPGMALGQVLATGSHVPIASVLLLPRADVDAVLGASDGAGSGSSSSSPPAAPALVVATAQGFAKRTALVAAMLKPGGAQVAKVGDGDSVVGAALVRAGDALLLSTDDGRLLAFHSDTVTLTGRAAKGVIGMRVPKGAHLASLFPIPAATASAIPELVAAKGGQEEEEEGAASVSGSATSSATSGMASLLPAVAAQPGVDVLLVWKSGGAKRVAVSELRMQARAAVGLNARPNLPANANDTLLGAWIVARTDYLILDLGGGDGEVSLAVADVPLKSRIQAAVPLDKIRVAAAVPAIGRQPVSPGQGKAGRPFGRKPAPLKKGFTVHGVVVTPGRQ